MSASDTITVLRAVDGAKLTKTITRRQGGGYDIQAYDSGFLYAVARLPVASIIDAGRLIAKLELDPHCCIIRGAPLPGTNLSRTRRLIYDHVDDDGSVTPATFEAEPSQLLGIDVDSLDCPAWCPEALAARRAAIERDRAEHPIDQLPPKGPSDGEDYDFEADGDPAPIDPARDPELIARAAVSTLPPEFADAHCWWQMTSSAGIKPGIRLRLWYWIDRPVSDAEAKHWLGGCEVDTSLYSPVQPHYVARPIFRPPSLDPVPQRSGFFWRHVNEVPVPELPEPEPPPAPPERQREPAITGDHREVARQCLKRADLTVWERDFCAKMAAADSITPKQAETLAKIADPQGAGAEAYARAALLGVESAMVGGRHPTLMGVAVRLYSLVDAGLLDPTDITRRLLAAAEKPLNPSERRQRCARLGGRPSANEQAVDWARARARAAPDLPEGFRS